MVSFNGTLVINQPLAHILQDIQDIIVDKVVGEQVKLYKFVSQATDEVYDEGAVTFAAPIESKVYIDWSPSQHKLRNLGIMIEDRLPIIGRMLYSDDVPVGSVIVFPYEFYRNQMHSHCLQVVDRIVEKGINIEVKTNFVFAPVRDSIILPNFVPWTP